MRTVIAGVTVLTLIVSSPSLTHADGVPENPGPAYAPFSWTGFYLGANGGYGDDYNRVGNFVLSSNAGFTAAAPAVQPQGGFGGGQLGYNWLRGPLLLGVEADLQGADVSNGFTGRLLDAGGDLLNAHLQMDYFGTVRGRVGFANYHSVFYATAGFAYGGVRDQLLVHNPGTGEGANLNTDNTRTGYAVGGGVEQALAPHWSVKVEYQHIDLGSERLTASVSPPGITITSNRILNVADTIRVGVNYRFNNMW